MRGALRVLAVLLVLAVAGAVIELVLERLDRAAVPRRGVMADAGGHRLRLLVTGAPGAAPTVLLECGIGGATAPTWAWVQRGVTPFARVVSYDRAGLGESEPGPMPRDGRRLIEELHRALADAHLPPPYVFVGHSYGGLLARLFVARYPNEVVGLVLCESSHPGQFGRDAPRRPPRFITVLRSLSAAAPWAARIGLVRLVVAIAPIDADLLPPLERAEQLAYYARPSHWVGTTRELQAWVPLTNPEARAAPGFGSRPLFILTAGESARGWGPWIRLQGDVARLSTDAVHRVEPRATHGSLIADSSHAAVVVRAIHDVLEAVRSGRRLSDVAAASDTTSSNPVRSR